MSETTTGERADLLETLAFVRHFLRQTAEGLTDAQARQRTTVSELSLGGLIKHVALTEEGAARFIVDGPTALVSAEGGYDALTPEDWAERAREFQMLPDETLADILVRYEEIASRTDELVRTVDLDSAQPLPPAPWFEPGEIRSARRTVQAIIAETAQHAGHADIVREALDGRKSMG